MPGIFQEVRVGWGEQEYVIAPDQLMRLIAMIEDVITLPELFTARQSMKLPFAKIATAYGIMLRYAGARCTDEEVYRALFEVKNADRKVSALQALQTLLLLMMPPDTYKGEDTPKGKEPSPVARKSSRKRTS